MQRELWFENIIYISFVKNIYTSLKRFIPFLPMFQEQTLLNNLFLIQIWISENLMKILAVYLELLLLFF